MSAQEFDELLCQFKRRVPFEPFEVEMADGRVIEIVQPTLVFDGSGAGYLSPSDELIDFKSADVRSIHPLSHEVAR